jgi:hypothetical protein
MLNVDTAITLLVTELWLLGISTPSPNKKKIGVRGSKIFTNTSTLHVLKHISLKNIK